MTGLFGLFPQWLVEADKALFKLINTGLYHPLMADIMKFTANDIFLIAVLFTGYIVLIKPDLPGNKAAVAFSLWALIAVNGLNTHLLKPAFGRLRPPAELDGVNLLVTMKKMGWAFPSTHTAMAAALCAVLWGGAPKARPYLAGFTALIAFFCVYTGGHYPLDTVAGAVVGTAAGAVFAVLKDMYLKKQTQKS